VQTCALPILPFKYTADYAYFNADSIFSIISTLPSTEESLENWYQKNNLLTRQFEKYGDIVYLYDNLKFTTEKHQILDDLNNQTEKIKIFDVKKDFEKLESFSTLTLANSSDFLDDFSKVRVENLSNFSVYFFSSDLAIFSVW